MNGAVAGSKHLDGSWTRDSHRIDGGSVIDYFVASPNIFARLSNLQVISHYGHSDHNVVTLGWHGKPSPECSPSHVPLSELSSADGMSVPGMAIDEQAELRVGPNGWCFLGSLSEDERNDFVARIVIDPRLSGIV